MKSKSLYNIEQRMEELEPESLRYKVLDTARKFKTSWMELGQYLATVYGDKLFKEWGYLTFEAYCSKEIGIRQATAVKLLKSYSFLEREEPAFLKKQLSGEKKPAEIPSFESVNALRLAKSSERIPERDYNEIREEVLDNGKEEAEVKKKIRYILNSHPRSQAPEEKEKRRDAALRKILSSLRVTKSELQELSFPAKVLKQIDDLVDALSELQE